MKYGFVLLFAFLAVAPHAMADHAEEPSFERPSLENIDELMSVTREERIRRVGQYVDAALGQAARGARSCGESRCNGNNPVGNLDCIFQGCWTGCRSYPTAGLYACFE